MMPLKSSAHRERMAARRARQLARTPGFTPVPNKRIDARVWQIAVALQGLGFDPVAALEEAWQRVAATLPPLPIGRRRGGKPVMSTGA